MSAPVPLGRGFPENKSVPFFSSEGIENAGLQVEAVKDNPQYRFISDSAQGATRKYGVKSVSILAVKG